MSVFSIFFVFFMFVVVGKCTSPTVRTIKVRLVHPMTNVTEFIFFPAPWTGGAEINSAPDRSSAVDTAGGGPRSDRNNLHRTLVYYPSSNGWIRFYKPNNSTTPIFSEDGNTLPLNYRDKNKKYKN